MERVLDSSAPPWLDRLMAQENVTDICVNAGVTQGHGVFFDQGRGLEKMSDAAISGPEMKAWVLGQLAKIGKAWDAKFPFVDAALPSGFRLHVAFGVEVAQSVLVSLRKINGLKSTKREWVPKFFFDFLKREYSAGKSLIISGATGSGKTTLASDLLSHIPEHQRVIALEDTPELAPAHPHFVTLVSRPPNADGHGEIHLRHLLRQSLRMRPDRIVLGECRGAEILDFLQAINTGHAGALATLHANSPQDAIQRVELLSLLWGEGLVPVDVIRELLVRGVHYLVQVTRTENKRAIEAIWKMGKDKKGGIALESISEMSAS